MKMLFDNVDGNTTLKQFAEIENKVRDIQKAEEDAQISRLQGQRNSIQNEIDSINSKEKSLENNQRLNELLKQQYEIDGRILDIEVKREKAISDIRESMKRATVDYLNSVSGSALSDFGFSSLTKFFDETTYEFINDLGEIETKSASTFEKMFDQAQTFGEKFAVAFNAITSVAQQAFAFINQASAASFQMEYENLERRYEIAQRFAGQGEEAQEEVRRQYEERRRDIRRRELEAQKEQAIFNAVINVSQGVTAALATANIPLSILIGALGAAQIAFIASQQIPAYATGTQDHIGGNMLVNDASGSNYREMIVEPNKAPYIPKGRNRVINAPKGTKVFTAHETKEMQSLNKMLMSNDIAPISDTLTRDSFSHIPVMMGGSGMNKEDMKDALAETLGNMPMIRQNWDKNGMNEWYENQGNKTILTNNRVSFKGISL